MQLQTNPKIIANESEIAEANKISETDKQLRLLAEIIVNNILQEIIENEIK